MSAFKSPILTNRTPLFFYMQLPEVRPTAQGPAFGRNARDFDYCDPFVTVFLYMPEASFCVKGWHSETEEWIARTVDNGRGGQTPYISHTLFWKEGVYRSYWSSNVFYIQRPRKFDMYSKRGRVNRYTVSPRQIKDRTLSLRRMPKGWIATFDALLDPKFDWENDTEVQ